MKGIRTYILGLISFLLGVFFINICFFEMGFILLVVGLATCWESIPLPYKRKG